MRHHNPSRRIRRREHHLRDPVFRDRVKAGQRIIEDQKTSRTSERPRQAKALGLTTGAGRVRAGRGIPLRQARDEVVGLGLASRPLDVDGPPQAQGDRVRDGRTQQHRPLEGTGHRRTQLVMGERVKGNPVEQHLPLSRIRQPRRDSRQQRLPRTTAPHNRKGRPPRHDQIDPVENDPVPPHSPHPPQLQPPRPRRQPASPEGRRLPHMNLRQPPRPGPRADEPRQLPRQHAHSGREDRVPRRREDIPRRQPVPGEQEPGDCDHTELQQRRDRDGLRGGTPLHVPHPPPGVGEFGQGPQDARGVTLGGAGRLDRTGPLDRLGERRGDPPLNVLVPHDALGRITREHPQQQRQHRCPGEKDDGEPGIEHPQRHHTPHRPGHRRGQRGPCSGRRPRLSPAPHDPGHQIPRLEPPPWPQREHLPHDPPPQEGGRTGVDGPRQHTHEPVQHHPHHHEPHTPPHPDPGLLPPQQQIERPPQHGGQRQPGPRGPHTHHSQPGTPNPAVPQGVPEQPPCPDPHRVVTHRIPFPERTTPGADPVRDRPPELRASDDRAASSP
ncbi:hypothetical protein a10_03312 [Streptomyces acidiscabies]|nr:hypothetical protein a10_03312 [Streptomyces acidiscabies]GAV40875.1 hypothetical protein Saa2_03775 [Streptomyces acidiscabies]